MSAICEHPSLLHITGVVAENYEEEHKLSEDVMKFIISSTYPKYSVTVHRSYHDLRAIKRLEIAQTRNMDTTSPDRVEAGTADMSTVVQTVNRFPGVMVKKLLEKAWLLDGEGWVRSMTKGLREVNRWLQHVLKDDAVRTDFMDEDAHATRRRNRVSRREGQRRARELQQFFTCDVNSQYIVHCAANARRNDQSQRKRVLYIEPACGDGRVLKELLTQISSSGVCSDEVMVFACDIDPLMVRRASERIYAAGYKTSCGLESSSSATPPKPNIHGISSSFGDGVCVCVQTCDYLSLDVAQLARFLKLPESELDGSELDGWDVVVVGNPPYTLGVGSLSLPGNEVADTGREFPLQFLLQSVHLRACCVVMLLPGRCGKESFVRKAQLAVIAAQSGEFHWEFNSQEAPSTAFTICEHVVHQTCVIHTWTRGAI